MNGLWSELEFKTLDSDERSPLNSNKYIQTAIKAICIYTNKNVYTCIINVRIGKIKQSVKLNKMSTIPNSNRNSRKRYNNHHVWKRISRTWIHKDMPRQRVSQHITTDYD